MSLFTVKTWIFSSFAVRWKTWTSLKDLLPTSSFSMHFMQGHELSLELHLKFKWFISFLCHLKDGFFKHPLYKLWLPSKALKPRRCRRFNLLLLSELSRFPMNWLFRDPPARALDPGGPLRTTGRFLVWGTWETNVFVDTLIFHYHLKYCYFPF